jgi:hypothetical protein
MSSDQDFRAARRAGARGLGRLAFPVAVLAVAALFAGPLTSGEPSPLYLGIVTLVAGFGLVRLVIEVSRLARNRGIWARAARGAVSLTLRGEAVAKKRNVSGRPMRTVVVQHRGERQYLHLLFAKGGRAETLRQGPVTVEFFTGNDVHGPARLLLPDGRTLWAFTSRLGARPPVNGRRAGARTATSSSTDAGAGAVVVGGYGLGDDGAVRNREVPAPDNGDGTGESTWTGGDGWTGGGSWGSDSTWSGGGSDGGGGGGWFGGDSGGGGWSGGDSGGGGGDSGGGGGS